VRPLRSSCLRLYLFIVSTLHSNLFIAWTRGTPYYTAMIILGLASEDGCIYLHYSCPSYGRRLPLPGSKRGGDGIERSLAGLSVCRPTKDLTGRARTPRVCCAGVPLVRPLLPHNSSPGTSRKGCRVAASREAGDLTINFL
jgi:hypothetical protein